MKYNYKEIELLEPIYFDNTNELKRGIEIHENQQLNPFIYHNGTDVVKLVLMWVVELTKNNKTHHILTCKAEQEILVQLEGDYQKDKTDLRVVFSTSHLLLEHLIQKHNPSLSNYTLLYFDPAPGLDEVLSLLQQQKK